MITINRSVCSIDSQIMITEISLYLFLGVFVMILCSIMRGLSFVLRYARNRVWVWLIELRGEIIEVGEFDLIKVIGEVIERIV